MIVDSSALCAILNNEPEAAAFNAALRDADRCSIAAPTLVETTLVIASRYGLPGLDKLDALMAGARIETVAFDASHAALAREAFLRFGKGRHPAALNFGDCCAYALARATGRALLFKGGAFARTDVAAA